MSTALFNSASDKAETKPYLLFDEAALSRFFRNTYTSEFADNTERVVMAECDQRESLTSSIFGNYSIGGKEYVELGYFAGKFGTPSSFDELPFGMIWQRDKDSNKPFKLTNIRMFNKDAALGVDEFQDMAAICAFQFTANGMANDTIVESLHKAGIAEKFQLANGNALSPIKFRQP